MTLFFLVSFILLSTFFHQKESSLYTFIYGEWSRCIEGQIKKTYSFDHLGNFKRHKVYYETKNDCEGPLSYEHTLLGTYELYGKERSSNKLKMKLDIIIKKAQLTTHDKLLTKIYNERSVCDFEDWKQDETKEVTGIIVDDCKQYEEGTKIYRYLEPKESYFKLGKKSFTPVKRSGDFKTGLYKRA